MKQNETEDLFLKIELNPLILWIEIKTCGVVASYRGWIGVKVRLRQPMHEACQRGRSQEMHRVRGDLGYEGASQ
jgi:hypothetical protein